MVKVIERSERMKRCDTLVEIAIQEMGDTYQIKRRPSGNVFFSLYPADYPADQRALKAMGVFTPLNMITPKHEQYLDDAVRLAEAYESATGEEFTVRKDY